MIRDAYRWVESVCDDRIAKFFGWTGKRITPFYWFRAHTFNRYHIINISGQDGYKWGWTDSDSKMELACFKILVDFVEKEYPGYVDWDYDEDIKKIRDEFMEIYEWWTKGKKAEEDVMNKIFEESGWDWSFVETPETKAESALRKLYSMNTTVKDPAKYAEYVKRQEAAEEKQEEMLIKLIKIRKYLWT